MQSRTESSVVFGPQEITTLLEFFPQGVCAFDLEMTGLSPVLDKIIEIAAIKVDQNGEISHFHELINPLIPIPEYTIQYHKLTNEKLRDKPSLKRPLQSFLEFFGNCPLVAHNAIYDAGFLIKGIHEFNFKTSLSDVFDSCKFSRSLFKKAEEGPNDFKLSSLAKYYDLSFNHHQALDDAYVCLKVLIKNLEFLKEQNRQEEYKKLGFLFKLNSYQRPEAYLLPDKLKYLEKAIPAKEVISIKYKGGSIRDDYRQIKPLSLMALPQGLMLYGECLNSKMNKYFQVRKIQKLKQIKTK